MKYRKPEIQLPTEAIETIESHTKGIGLHENPDTNPIKSTPAYQADE